MTATGTGETGHDGVAAADLPPGLAQVRHLARHQIMGLTAAFLLGMAANLTRLPSQTRGAAHIARIAFLAAHVLIALGPGHRHRTAAARADLHQFAGHHL